MFIYTYKECAHYKSSVELHDILLGSASAGRGVVSLNVIAITSAWQVHKPVITIGLPTRHAQVSRDKGLNTARNRVLGFEG